MGPMHMAWTMPADAASVPLVRHHVVRLLHANGCAEQRIAEAALMTSELATNAVVHARTPFTVTIDLSARRLRVDVRDASKSMPVISTDVPSTATGGRGLTFVAAFADCWGCEPVSGGKKVWFESA